MNRELPALPDALPGPVTDSHCHLDVAEEYSGLAPEDALAQAASVGVTRLVQVGCDLPSSRWAVAAASRWPSVVATVALHPNDAARLGDRLPQALEELAALVAEEAADPARRLRGVGETGLDWFRTPEEEGRHLQRESFAAHIALARRHDLTLVVHDRDAHDEVLEVLDAEGGVDRLVMHCFSGDADFARRCLDRGAWLSFPGTVTFKPNQHLRDALRLTPTDRVLTETDAPFLTPVPHRGRPNASFLVPLTVRFMAEQRGEDLAGFCASLHDNASAAFGGSW
ncbi:TatD family hydrolase [Auraticoccus monumenti]|uniref:TatD DNase family protein n=1 Tax=Auraticoccus monumenti TaxID=675864 RepID=A0A1G6YNG6_9ACTN|nr:TatD family hydrolase [Auraticoccus monumenti]SDD91851.1 TatD DNase family protein [Auraticoccus monumenti]